MNDTAPPPVVGPQKEKEQEPVSRQDYLEQVERTPEIPPEVAKVGVAPVTGPTLKEEDRKVGLEPVKEEVPVTTTPQGLVKLPLTEAEARSVLRLHKKITEAIVWLANFVLRQFKVFRLRQKETYGNP